MLKFIKYIRNLPKILNEQEKVINQINNQINQIKSENRNFKNLLTLFENELKIYRVENNLRINNQTFKHSPPCILPELDISFKEANHRLEQLAPTTYKIWYEVSKAALKSYEGFNIDSCSVSGHEHAKLFQQFIFKFIKGYVLDIGCGPQTKPLYLEGYPNEYIYGIDPIKTEHPFHFFHGLAEFIPWDDNSFDTITCATSLDHVLLLDKTFSEIERVLKPGGQFIVWSAFVKGSAKYNPYSQNIKPVDQYHLFHFDKSWFEKMIIIYFNIEASIHFDAPTNSEFYILKSKRNMNNN